METFSETDIVILCGGLGTRLRKTIGEKQKTMAEISGRPFLDILLDYIAARGGKRAILCAGYHADDVEKYFESRKDLGIAISNEDEPLGTGGALKNAAALVHSQNFIAMNGDCFCPVDYQGLLDFHLSRNALATLTVSVMKGVSDYGTIRVDEQGRISAFEEKAPGGEGLVNVGVYCFRKEILEIMPSGPFSIERDFFPAITGRGMFAFVTQQEFLDIGTPQRLKEAAEKIQQLKGKTL